MVAQRTTTAQNTWHSHKPQGVLGLSPLTLMVHKLSLKNRFFLKKIRENQFFGHNSLNFWFFLLKFWYVLSNSKIYQCTKFQVCATIGSKVSDLSIWRPQKFFCRQSDLEPTHVPNFKSVQPLVQKLVIWASGDHENTSGSHSYSRHVQKPKKKIYSRPFPGFIPDPYTQLDTTPVPARVIVTLPRPSRPPQKFVA